MWNLIARIITPISFPDDETKSRLAGYLHWITLALLVGIPLYAVTRKIESEAIAFNLLDSFLIVAFVGISITWIMARNGYVKAAGVVLIAILWLTVNASAYLGAGTRDLAFLANIAIMLTASLLFGWQAAIPITFLTMIAGFGVAYAEVSGLLPATIHESSPFTVFQNTSLVYTIIAVLIYLLIGGLESAIARVQAEKSDLENAMWDLNQTHNRLEENRNELLVANEQLKRRIERFNAIANISKTITLAQDIDRLLPSLARAISQRFGYHHAGIYLLDEQKHYALLKASNSAGGVSNAERGYRIPVGGQDLVGMAADRGQPRIASDSGKTAPVTENSLLPDTRSQIALPLKVAEVVIGVLDIQSTESNAFNDEDVSTLLVLADQAAIAIQNGLTADQAREALRQVELASQQSTGKVWREYTESLRRRGYRYDGIKPEALKAAEFRSELGDGVSIPLQLRGHTIGRLKLQPPDPSRKWTDDEIAVAQATAERVALVLDGARLLENAQIRAQRESFLAEVSTRLGSSFQIDSILRDTVEELGLAFKNTTISFQLVNPLKPPESDPDEGSPFAATSGKDLE